MLTFLSSYGFTIVLLGLGATLFMDVWAWLQQRLLRAPSLSYALVGRWLGHMSHGQLRHHPIMAAAPIKHEHALGWLCHYAIGVLFSGLHLAFFGPAWLDQPTLWPALVSGLLSLAAPFFILQPCFGFGFAAAKTPKPWLARLKSTVAHTVFGLGLYLTAWLLA
ncbi:MAG: DUF2938 domain-containing protein [Neisseriaceae bacterium]|nr:DUF2938 domain-containing protein [Neisseriaceae bacterium]